jgi:peptidoglycan/LPS O-acetylase OafA/YrhL
MKRLDAIDGLRGVAALNVVLCHIITIFHATRTDPRFMWAAQGQYAVDLFIVLSGYCLILPVMRNGFRLPGGFGRFMWRRFLRLYPAYIAAMVLMIALHFTLTRHLFPLTITWQTIAYNLLMVQDFTKSAIVRPAWSLAVEWHIYLCFPLLLWLWRRAGLWQMLVIVTGVSVALAMAIFSYASYLNLVRPEYLALFAFGAAAAYVLHGEPAAVWVPRLRRVPWGWVALVLYAACIGYTYTDLEFPLYQVEFLSCAAALSTIAACMLRGGMLARFMESSPLVWLGSVSYSLYLIHVPIIWGVFAYFLRGYGHDATRTVIWMLVFLVPYIVGASYLFARAFEFPFMRLRDMNKKPSAEHKEAVFGGSAPQLAPTITPQQTTMFQASPRSGG